jgi:hypothetical protein
MGSTAVSEQMAGFGELRRSYLGARRERERVRVLG